MFILIFRMLFIVFVVRMNLDIFVVDVDDDAPVKKEHDLKIYAKTIFVI